MRLWSRSHYKATIIKCDRHEARANWDEARGFLCEALYRGIGDLTEQDLKDLCFNGDAALLIFTDPYADLVGSAVTQLLKHPDGRVILKILAYGAKDFEPTRHCLELVEDDAKSMGAQAVHFHGRQGWLKVCGPMGYQVKQVIMEKVLGGEEGLGHGRRVQQQDAVLRTVPQG